MITELKTFKVCCDMCKKTEIVCSTWSWADLPKGWGTSKVHDCGLTGYTKTDDLCPECLKKSEDKQ